jgi:hypothetical protein
MVVPRAEVPRMNRAALAVFAFVVGCGGQRTSSDGAADAASDAPHASEVPLRHRAQAIACVLAPPVSEPAPNTVTFGQCMKNEDCKAGKNGTCVGDIVHGSRCAYDTCAIDSDCAAMHACACGANGGRSICVGSNCLVDADCGPSGFCSPSPDASGRGVIGYFCHAPSDACINDSDCPQMFDQCGYVSGAWTCFSPGGD